MRLLFSCSLSAHRWGGIETMLGETNMNNSQKKNNDFYLRRIIFLLLFVSFANLNFPDSRDYGLLLQLTVHGKRLGANAIIQTHAE